MRERAKARQGEVWLAQLVGKNTHRDRDNEHHIRLTVVVSTDLYNELGLAFLVAPILKSTRGREELPTNLALDAGEGGVAQPSAVICMQMRTVAPWRMIRRIGALSPTSLRALKDTLRITFDLL